MYITYIAIQSRSFISMRTTLKLLLAQQPLSVKACLPVPLVGLAFSDLLIFSHSRIVSPTYGGTVHLGLEPLMSPSLSHTS